MLDMDKFPLEIGTLKRKQGSNTFFGNGTLACSIDRKKNKIVIGIVSLGIEYAHIDVKDEEEAIKIIKDFKFGNRKITEL